MNNLIENLMKELTEMNINSNTKEKGLYKYIVDRKFDVAI